jgi:acetyl esterase/lipase
VSGGRGQVLSSALVAHLSRAATAGALDDAGYEAPPPRYGLDEYRVVYRTVGVDGEARRASGLVVLPDGGGRELRVVSYDHGTMAAKDDAPSVDHNAGRAAAELFAARGYAAVAPDYLGLGLGPGRHPYMDAATEASASLDMLRAARAVAAEHGRGLRPDVLVTGFSQGGHAAMALAGVLRQGGDPYFRAAAVAPVSGPYDVEHAEIPASFDGRLDPKEAVFYLGYWTTAMNRRYGLYDRPSQAFLPPYDRTVEELFDGLHSDEQVFTGLPDTLQELLTPRYLDWLRHPDGALARALRANDTTCGGWRPGVPVRLYAARGDRDVAIANSRSCQDRLAADGVRADLVDVGDATHFPSQLLAIPQVADWFDHLGR